MVINWRFQKHNYKSQFERMLKLSWMSYNIILKPGSNPLNSLYYVDKKMVMTHLVLQLSGISTFELPQPWTMVGFEISL